MINKKFGKLTVIKKTDLRDTCRRIIWKCQCECGNERLVDTSSLTSARKIIFLLFVFHTLNLKLYALKTYY